jgi:hypothetical protein
MKSVLVLLAVSLLGFSSHAFGDEGLRHVTCYSDWNTTVVFSGDYDVIGRTPTGETRARKVMDVNGGRCVLGDEVTLPECVSMTAQVYFTPPCSI